MSDSFRTEVFPEALPFSISHRDTALITGSCFSENIGALMQRFRFDTTINPHGIIFNPESIAVSLSEVIQQRRYSANDLMHYNGLYLSLNHHGKFNSRSQEDAVSGISQAIASAHDTLKKARLLMVTFGSAWAYVHNVTGKVVANCHKIPQQEFTKVLLRHDEIVQRWNEILLQLKAFNPELKIVFTVSPVRHWREGANGNQLSKAHLMLAAQELAHSHGNAFYFPAYEIMLDDLRDYRFYKEDMLHPGEVAIQYIWKKFSSWIFDEETLSKMVRMNPVLKFLEHRPLHTATDEFERLVQAKELELLEILRG